MTMQTLDLFQVNDSANEQLRLVRIQSYNWGTFNGVHNFPIAEGGFLFSGPSGAGKSTILDGHSALMTPPRWIKFNVAAAREANRNTADRNLMSYVRGAWAQQTGESGEAVSQFLRPDTTWSALVETYRSKQGRVVVLAELFWVRGKSTANTDIRKVYMIFEREFELRELEFFQKCDFDLRKLKPAFPEAFIREEFNAFQERFRMLLGIDSELALRLLHKAQSAKNLGELNTFLRDFMLEVPGTFEIADRLVSEFSELSAAHLAVVAAREQIGVLQPAFDTYQEREVTANALSVLKEVRAGAAAYEEQLKQGLYEAALHKLDVVREGAEAELAQVSLEVEREEAVLRGFQEERYQNGGGQLEELTAQLGDAERNKQGCQDRQARASAAAQGLGRTLPIDPREYTALVEHARNLLDGATSRIAELDAEKFDLKSRQRDLEATFAQQCQEIKAMESQPSNIPAHMLGLRRLIAQETGIPEARLPFAGELLEVKPDSKAWEGAIERVLHSFALSLLVDDADCSAVAKFVNSRNLRGRLVYLRMQPHFGTLRPLQPNSLVHKVKPATVPQAEWLSAELRAQFDYECAEDMEAFSRATKAVTKEGQIKQNSSKHIKDDRKALNDRSNWVLGFDNSAKLALFKEDAAATAASLARAGHALSQVNEAFAAHQQAQRHSQTLVNLSWAEIDLGALLDKVRVLQERIQALTAGNATLASIESRIKGQTVKVDRLRKEEQKIQVELAGIAKSVLGVKSSLSLLREELLDLALTPTQRDELTERYQSYASNVDLNTVGPIARKVDNALSDESNRLDMRMLSLKSAIENLFAEYNRRWPAESGGLDAVLLSADDYFTKLERLQKDNLPQFEERFLRLLREQSDQNLTQLSFQMDRERHGILERLELVNESLKLANYNPGTHLAIDPLERNLEEVRTFKAMLRAALSNSFGNTPEQAEARFAALKDLVVKLSSQDTPAQNWRALVLDVRQHVEFRARELDINNEEVEVYMSGAGKSGGQKQKLAAFILAAALRYQLGGPDRAVPRYATVVMDEAFDQADSEFTAMAMNIFKMFGFQLVVATPMKSVMAMEPYIEGACLVSIVDRKFSAARFIEYDLETKRLALNSDTLSEPALA